MPYQQSFAIERRLNDTLTLIRAAKHSTPSLAQKLGVSIPTVSRCIAALRERGYDINAEKDAAGWHYVFAEKRAFASLMNIRRAKQQPGRRQASACFSNNDD